MFVDTLRPDDRLAIVTYAGWSGLALPSTAARDRVRILNAIDHLQAGGSTNGGQGLITAYRVARDAFVPGGVNRVILATDGDFNVGIVGQHDLLHLIERERPVRRVPLRARRRKRQPEGRDDGDAGGSR
jgi:Ca-activated chloride channel family protein